MTEASPGPAGFAWQQGVALVSGAFYLVLGITGFFFVRDLGADVTGQSPDSLLGIDLNGAQNFLHILLGVAGLAMSTTRQRSRAFGALLAVVGVGCSPSAPSPPAGPTSTCWISTGRGTCCTW
jgi:hypothetical protein